MHRAALSSPHACLFSVVVQHEVAISFSELINGEGLLFLPPYPSHPSARHLKDAFCSIPLFPSYRIYVSVTVINCNGNIVLYFQGLIKRECAAAKKLGELLGGVNLMGGQSLMAWSCPIPAAKPGMEKPALGSPGVGHKARKAASLSVWLLAIYFLELAAVQVQHTACDVPRRVCDRGAAASTLLDGCGRVRVSVPIAVPVP